MTKPMLILVTTKSMLILVMTKISMNLVRSSYLNLCVSAGKKICDRPADRPVCPLSDVTPWLSRSNATFRLTVAGKLRLHIALLGRLICIQNHIIPPTSMLSHRKLYTTIDVIQKFEVQNAFAFNAFMMYLERFSYHFPSALGHRVTSVPTGAN